MAFFVATSLANLANFLFHVVMSRMLGPSTYGAVGSILGLSTVVTLAATAAQAAVTQAVAAAPPADPGAELRAGRSTRRTAVVGLGLFALVGALSPVMRGFLHLTSVVPVVLFGVFVAATVTSLVPQGFLVGRLAFRTVALALASGAVLRLATGPLFVGLGWGLNGAVAATVVNAVTTLGVLLWPLRRQLMSGPGTELRFSPRVALLAVLALGGVSAFVGTDSFLARHYLARTASGYYVAAATAARIALFLPAAIGMLAFPRLAAGGGRGPQMRAVLLQALGAVAALGAAAALVLAAFPNVVIDILFGARYAPAAHALRILAVAAAGIGVVTVGVYALLARRSSWSLVSWPALAALCGGIALVHHSVSAVAWVVAVASAGLLGVTLLVLMAPARRGRGSDAAVGGAAKLHTVRRQLPAPRTGTDPS